MIFSPKLFGPTISRERSAHVQSWCRHVIRPIDLGRFLEIFAKIFRFSVTSNL
jgi:hypothetical protein